MLKETLEKAATHTNGKYGITIKVPSKRVDKKQEMVDWFFVYANRIDSKKIDAGMIPPYVVNDLGKNGFFGMGISKKYGGVEFGVKDTLEILEILAAKDMSVAILILDSLLSAFTINNYASEPIKNAYLPDMATGRVLSAVAITETAAGANPRAMETYAEQDEVGNWVLNGQKRWVGYASWASFINVYAQTYIDGKPVGISGFFIPLGTEGLEILDEAETMGIKGFPKHTVNLKNVTIPKGNILGPPGKGMESAQSTFMYIRLCLGGLCLGSIKKLLQISTTYAFNRTIASGSLLDNPVSRITLTNLINGTTALETLIKVVADQLEREEIIPEPAFIVVKTIGGELLSLTADKSIQMLGARGYEEANMVAQMYRDGRPFRIFEGPTEVLLNYLGTQAYFDTGDVYQLLEQNFQNKKAANQLRAFVQKIKSKYDKETIFDLKDTNLWVYSVIGEIAQWMILSAALEFANEPALQGAKEWAETKVVEVLSYYQQKTAEEKTLLSSQNILHIVRGFESTVGQLQPARIGYHQQPDPMLVTPIPEKGLNGEERQKVLFDWNKQMDAKRDLNFITLFAKSVAQYPNRVAVSEKGITITYQELDNLSNFLAGLLQQKGVVAGDLIGLACERSLDMIIGIISVLKLGAGYIPFDKSFPEQRIKDILRETDPVFVLTQSTFIELPLAAEKLMLLDEVLATAKTTPNQTGIATFKPVDFPTTHPAYVIFTSGSTGIPKGVLISHQAMTNFAVSSRKKYQLTHQDKVLQFASLSFDASVEEIFPTLIAGATLMLRTESMLNSYREFLTICTEWEISVLGLPTAFWMNLAMSTQLQSNPKQLPETLRTVIIGGDKVSLQSLQYWDKLSRPDIDLWDTYGPTEATVVAVSKRLRGTNINAANSDTEILTIGRPDGNVCTYVVDENLVPVSVEEQGELLIGGANLGQYLHRPDLNKEKFIDNPFCSAEDRADGFNLKLYRTGDLVKYQANGEIVFVGRIDNQVKIRGFRVELGEIEAVMNAHPDVQQGVVIVHERKGFKELLAGVVFHNGETESIGSLLPFMGNRLPKYMLPAHIIPFASFPMTISKKVSRKKILKAILQQIDSQVTLSEGTSTLAKLVNIWQQVLGVSIQESSNFFNEGGHSLTVMQVIGKIFETFKVSISAREFFKNPTVQELTAIIDQKLHPEAAASLAVSTQANQEGETKVISTKEYPLSKPQTQFYLHSQLHGNVPLYNEPCLLTVHKPVSKIQLTTAIEKLIARHPILRTSFHQTEKGFYQTCHNSIDFSIDYWDLSKEAEDNKMSLMKETTQSQLKELFDLEQPGLFRCGLYKISPTESQIFLVFHHLVVDGVSLFSVFIPELQQLLDNPNQALAPLNAANDYKRFVEKEFIIQPTAQTYWEGVLEKHSQLTLPVDFKTEQVSVAGAEVNKSIAISKVKSISQKLGSSRFNVMATAVNILMTHYAQKETISLGTIISTRPYDMGQTMGVFLNTILLQTECQQNLSIQDCAMQVQEAILDAQEFAIPYEDLVKIGRNKQVEDLIQVALVYEPIHQKKYDFEVNRSFVHAKTAKFDLLLEFEEQANDTIHLRMEYKTDLFKAATIHRLFEHLGNVLEVMDQNILQEIGQVNLLTPIEKTALKGRKTNYQPMACPNLFERQVVKTPNNIAISFDGEALSYRALNQLSNQVAHLLMDKGIEQGEMVGLYLPRSIHQIATVMAILKVGGVFVPLDPAYPKKRLEFILNQTKIKQLITDDSLPPLAVKTASTIFINQELETIEALPKDNPNIPIPLDSLAYLTYTSGSTGQPKGAKVSHQPLSNLMQWQVERSPLNNRTIQFTPLSFDVSFQEIFATLTSGGTLVLVEEATRKNPADLINYIIDNQVSRLFLPFVALKQIAETVFHDMAPLPHTLTEIITAGEQLKTTEAIRHLFSQLKDCTLDNQYGPCETHVVTGGRLNSVTVQDWAFLPSIGQAVANLNLQILGKNQLPVPANTEGELYIGLDYEVFGYFENEPETTKRFRMIDGQAYYRTGDLVRYEIDGNIHWVDRADNQLKIRGYRIETGEVERALIDVASIQQAVVTAIEQSNEKVLVAYLQLAASEYLETETYPDFFANLKQALSQQIPSYMIPVHFKIVDDFRLTPSGKVARKLLPPFDLSEVVGLQQEGGQSGETGARINLNVDLEKEIISLFAEILAINNRFINRDSSFFDLGGSSLNGFLLVTKLANHYFTKINPSVLSGHPTPALLAALLSNTTNVTLSSLVEIRKGNDLPPIFLIPGSGGTLMTFDALLNQLPTDRTIYGFVHPRLRGNTVDLTEINDLANYYVTCLETETGAKSCYILGHSFGGAVAYEMSQILANKNRKAIPIIMDTPVPQASTKHLTADWTYAQWVAVVGEVLSKNAGYPLELMEEMKKMDDQTALVHLKETLVKAHLFAEANDLQHLKSIVDMLREFDISFMNYEPQKTNDAIYLLRAKQMTEMDELGILASGTDNLTWGWEAISDEIHCEATAGDHISMLEEENVAEIAQFLQSCFVANDESLTMM